MADKTSSNAYWAANIRVIVISMVVWFACSFGLGILLRPALSGIHIGGADIGFWFAQNGAIYVFLVLIFAYAAKMNKLDKEHGVEE
ncbi:MAG: membrane protein [Rhodobacter sp. CACIA14H1]|nr:MAG: membrane protein [Rhodobacter sp. CACIA14H1]